MSRKVTLYAGQPNPSWTERHAWGRLVGKNIFHASSGAWEGSICGASGNFYLNEPQEEFLREFCGNCVAIIKKDTLK